MGNIPVYGSNGIVGYHCDSIVKESSLIIGRKGAAGYIHLSTAKCWPIDTTYFSIPPNGCNIHFFYYLLKSLNLSSLDKSTAIPGLNRDDAYRKTFLIFLLLTNKTASSPRSKSYSLSSTPASPASRQHRLNSVNTAKPS